MYRSRSWLNVAIKPFSKSCWLMQGRVRRSRAARRRFSWPRERQPSFSSSLSDVSTHIYRNIISYTYFLFFVFFVFLFCVFVVLFIVIIMYVYVCVLINGSWCLLWYDICVTLTLIALINPDNPLMDIAHVTTLITLGTLRAANDVNETKQRSINLQIELDRIKVTTILITILTLITLITTFMSVS